MNRQAQIGLGDFIRERALSLGFYACGITPVKELSEDAEYLKSWLNSGRHGNMHYLENYFEERINPVKLLPGAQSLISVLLSYYPADLQSHTSDYKVSKYAYGKDYHKVMKKKMSLLLDSIREFSPEVNARIFVDSAPLLERRIAANAGLGWIGKNTLLIHPEAGSYFFIGEILCDLELDYNKGIADQCGRCTACLRACPTNALDTGSPYQMDASLCISYQTIEDRVKAKTLKGNKHWIFGCDICQDVCPWNRKSVVTTVPEFEIFDFIKNASTENWDNLDEKQFEDQFKGSSLKRAKFEGVRKNIQMIKENQEN